MTRKLLIFDANVLIDYVKSDPAILKLISKHVGQLYVTSLVLEEVNELNENDCDKLGITVIEPELKHLFQAEGKRGALSIEDHLNLILAKNNGWECVTNDRPLRIECEKEGVPIVWGIELICILVERGGLPLDHAKQIIKAIHLLNPSYIKEHVVQSAFERIERFKSE